MRDTVHFSPDVFDRICKLCAGDFSDFSVLVVGDIMLDKYISGRVKRISPEAPVPVFLMEDQYSVLGGAGNVVTNLRRLGVAASFIGRVGDDAEGADVESMLNDSGASVPLLVRSGVTSVKSRLLGNGHQQMIRLDREEILIPTAEESDSVRAAVRRVLEGGVGAVVVSDYGKGFFRGELAAAVIEVCSEFGVPVFVDPKGTDWSMYRGAFAVTPNVSEISAVLGGPLPNEDSAVASAGCAVRDEYSLQNLVVTRSDKGVTLVSEAGVLHVPSFAVEVFDVSGAGDTVIAVLAASAASGLDMADSVRLANIAGQIVVGKAGTSPIEISDLLSFLRCSKPSDKICGAEAAAERVRFWQSRGECVVFTNGCFDIFHAGHADSLELARSLGDHLVVGLNSDRSVRSLKGESRPVNGEAARARVIAAMSDVDLVVIFDEDTPRELLSLLRPDIIAKGGDYKPCDVAGGEYAGKVVILPLTEGFSTTGIIERMKSDGSKQSRF